MNKIYKFLTFEERTEKILNEYSLIPHTRSSRLFSTVRRMKAEKELGIPLGSRTGFVISTETGNRANEMTEVEWEKFYEALRNELRTDYPDIYARLFSHGEKFCDRCGVKAKDHCSGWWMVCGGLYGKKEK